MLVYLNYATGTLQHERFIELSNGSRDLVFADPDAGFSFDDPDGKNGAMVYTDGSR
jgi:hypothetical protein